MLRKDRLLTNVADMKSILERSAICRLAFSDSNDPSPYIVPMSYGYELVDDHLRLVFHCAQKGHKLDLLAKNPHVGFEMDCGYQLVAATTACGYGCQYESIVGTGVARLITEPHAKKQAINLLMQHVAGCTPSIEENVLAHTTVFEVIANAFSAKRHK